MNCDKRYGWIQIGYCKQNIKIYNISDLKEHIVAFEKISLKKYSHRNSMLFSGLFGWRWKLFKSENGFNETAD